MATDSHGVIGTDSGQSLQDKIDAAKVNGWKVQRRSDEKAIMIKRGKASFFWHVVILILTSWWTFGFGNILYWMKCRYSDAERITLHAPDSN